MKKYLLPLLFLCFALTGMASTDRDCLPPTHLTVSSVTAFTAHLDWEGDHESYILLLGQEKVVHDVDFETGDFSQAAFTTTTPDYPWTIEDYGYGSSFSAKSTNAGVGNTVSDLVLEVNLSTDMMVSFSGAVSSENGFDRGAFCIDGIEMEYFSGQMGWTSKSFPLTAGTHTLRWYYSKDMNMDAGLDCFQVDNIKIGYADRWERDYPDGTSFTYESLSEETSYIAKVVGICESEQSEPSRAVCFTTTTYCRTPKELRVSDVTEKEATLNWVANGMAYYIQFGKLHPAIDADFETGDFSQADFTTTSSYPWILMRDPGSNNYYARSTSVSMQNNASALFLQVNEDSEMFVCFSAKISSELGFDRGCFSIDDEEKMCISGEVGWTDTVFLVPEGAHTLCWKYSKYSNGSSGDDCFYVDNVKLGGVEHWMEYDTDETFYTFSNLEPRNTYVTRVQSSCEFEMSSLSRWLCFTTPSNHSVSEYPALDNAVPFAFYDNGLIRIDNEGEAILHIVDVLGRTVGIENVNESQIVSVNLKAGVYMLQLVQDQKVRTQKILVR